MVSSVAHATVKFETEDFIRIVNLEHPGNACHFEFLHCIPTVHSRFLIALDNLVQLLVARWTDDYQIRKPLTAYSLVVQVVDLDSRPNVAMQDFSEVSLAA